MRILIIGDVHSQYDVVNQQIQFAEKTIGTKIDAVIVLGDMGIYEKPLKSFFEDDTNAFIRKLYFIDGNHEEFSKFDFLVNQYREFMTYLPRGQVTKIGNFRFLSIGGACYMDALNSPSGSEIKDNEIELCLKHKKK